MKCHTISHFDERGNTVFKEKQRFKTLDDAIVVAKIMNRNDDREFKVVAYKCQYCYQYHIGKNGNLVTDRDRNKLRKQIQW